MKLLLIAVALFIVALSIWIVGISLKKQSTFFLDNMKSGVAEVIGYKRDEQSNSYTMLVKLLDLHDETMYSCMSGDVRKYEYQIGSIVDVTYAKKTVLGRDFYEIHLSNNPPANGKRIAEILLKIAFILGIVSAIIAVVGIIKLF